MSRFQRLVLCTAATAAGMAWVTDGPLRILLLVLVFAAFVILTGLGVAFPTWQLFGRYVCHVAHPEPVVSLTFDDGPDLPATQDLLDLLKRESIQAAFFCIGRKVEAHPELVARMTAEGHLVGNHSYQHSNATNFYSKARLVADIVRADEAIRMAGGEATPWFRPPMGLTNPPVFRALEALNKCPVGWTVRGLDTRTSEPERIVARILRGVKPGAIILLHDGGLPAGQVLETARLLVARLREKGYRFLRLDQLLGGL